jgi:hypothetical protein
MTTISLADMIRQGQVNHKVDMERILAEVAEEQCELCGAKTKDVGNLFSKDSKDERGHHIVLMVCAKCSKKHESKPKPKSKKGKA